MEISGTLVRIVYYNEENGYTIGELETEDDAVTVVGELPFARTGTTYLLEGEFTVHPKYGEQFSFSHAEETVPSTAEGIRAFLASGTISGVGPKTAAAMVRKFGEKTLSIIENDPDRLREVDGIGEKTAMKIADSFVQHREFAKVALEFSGFGINSAQSYTLYAAYGKDALKVVKDDPYRLIEEVNGIGFRKADAIAEKLGFSKDDPKRVKSGVIAYLEYAAGEGNTYLPEAELEDRVAEELDVTHALTEECTALLAFDGKLMTDDLDGTRAVYLYPYYVAENKVVSNIAALMDGELKPLESDLESSIRETCASSGITLSEKQKAAVVASVGEPVSVITGGPGTGKTTIIKSIIDIFERSGFSVALAAPTGRAAKRMEQTTGHPASTVHRLLEYYKDDESGQMLFGKDEEDPLDYDVIIIDESSMIDLMLMKGITDAVKIDSRLILVGDSDQLPSVGAGNVLHDLIGSGMVHTVKLTEIFRQAEESMIVVNAHRINTGEYPLINTKDKDFFFLERKSDAEIRDLIVDLVTRRLPKYYSDLDPLSDIQVLTPMHKRTIGTTALNAALQEEINPPVPGCKEKKHGDYTFREGDKIMQIRNDYEIKWRKPGGAEEGEGVFNGDVGVIRSIDPDDGKMTVVYDDDRFCEYDFDMLDEIEPAYAMTVHKSQGNEFPVIVMPVSAFPPVLATRNLLYTAITRGERAVVLVGSRKWMNAMVDNNRIRMRYSGLEQKLSDFRAVTGK